MQTTTRLAIAGCLLIATTVVTGVWSITAFRRVSNVVGQTVRENEHVTDATTKLTGALEREDDALLLVLRGSRTGQTELARQRNEVATNLARISDPALHVSIGQYEAAVSSLVASADAPDARERYHDAINPLLLNAVARANELRDAHFRSSQHIAEWAGVQSTRSMQTIAAISVIALLLLVLVVVQLARAVILQQTLEATLEAFPDAVMVVDNKKHVTAANPRARKTMPLRDVDKVLETGATASVDLANTLEFDLDGRKRRLLPRAVPIANGKGVVLVLSDVTELAKLDEMRLELVAVASHELRTPLTTMRMTLTMLHERAAQYQPHDREVIETAMLGVEQLAVLVDEFLDLTRIEAGQLRLTWTRLALRDLLARAVKTAEPSAEQAGVTLSYDSEDVALTADQARLMMVVSNLLSNAVKYTPAGGRIEMHGGGDDAHVTITVDDSGPGVPEEFRERVFERFFRVDTAPASGVGIGLYIARQVIEAHGGTLRCEASPLGGARFTATLPTEKRGKSPEHV
jgi:NtrC-family two-component system sensor histidine kinase KinB